MPDSIPRVALIGVSGYARLHLRFLEELAAAGRIVLPAVTVVNAAEERETVDRLKAGGCQVYPDFHAMLAAHSGHIDLCCIPTGIPLHRLMTIAALGAGANVLVEKPLAPTSADVTAVCAAERASGRWVAVGFQDLYAAENRSLKRHLLSGAVGRLRRIALRGLWPRDSSYYRRNSWAGRIVSEGRPVFDSPLSNAFSHFLNLALFLAGTSSEVSARPVGAEGQLWRAQAIENFDTAAVRLQTDAGVDVLAYVSHSCATILEPELAIEGDAGTVRWRSGRDYEIHSAGGRPARTELPDADALRRIMFREVVARLGDPLRPVCGTAIAAEHTRASELVQRLPIERVPAEELERRSTGGGNEQAAIVGLEERFAAAWKERRLPAEVSV